MNIKYENFIEDLINKKSLYPCLMKDYYKNPINGKILLLRHDVDYDFEIKLALNIAKIEHKLGVVSTFFLLPFTKYFQNINKLKEFCLEITELGHEIGLHNDAVTQWLINKIPINEYFIESLQTLRNMGIDVIGTASHGSKHCYPTWNKKTKESYYNYEIWKEFNSIKNEGISSFEMPKFSLSDFKLKYEAYFLHFDFYLSDSGKKWRGYQVKNKKWFEKTLLKHKDNIGFDILNKIDSQNLVFQLLIHPVHWEVNNV